MLNINTNLSSLLVQTNMKISTHTLNQVIERMSTGFKINHAKDNAANYSISVNMSTKINSCMVAEDNVAAALDMISTAEGALNEIQNKIERLNALQEQASNGTYGEQSLKAINAEVNALVDEVNRLYSTAEYNGIKLFVETTTAADGNQVYEQETSADKNTTFADLGISDTTIDIYNGDTKEETLDISSNISIGEFFDLLEPKGFNATISNGQIMIESTNGKYLAGALADELGISTREFSFVQSTSTTFDPNIEVVTSSLATKTDYITTTTSATQTNTVWSTTTVDVTNTATVDVTTTTYVSQSNTLLVTTSSAATIDYQFMLDPVSYSNAEVAAMTSLSSADSFVSGSTYSISTTAELEKFATLVNNGATTSNVTFVLGADIDLASVANWTQIKEFSGTFDGNGHVIKNLAMDSTEFYTAFFGTLYDAKIKNLGLEDVDIKGTSHASALFESNYGNTTITNCYVTGSIQGSDYAVGFTDCANGATLEYCYVDATIIAGKRASGLANDQTAGGAGVTITNCAVWGTSDLDFVFGTFSNEPGSRMSVKNCQYSTYYSGKTLCGSAVSSSNLTAVADPYAGGGGAAVTTTSTVSATTTLGEIGLTGVDTLSIYDNLNNLILSVNKDSTLQYVLDTLNAISGFSATLNNGILNVTTVGERYLNSSSDFFGFIPVTTSNSTSTSQVVQVTTTKQEQTSSTLVTQTVWTTTTTETTRTETVYTTNTIAATKSTKFEELGVSSILNVTISSNGTNSIVNINKDMTLGDFYLALESKGFEVLENASLVTLKGEGDTYISSNNLQNILGLSSVSKINATGKENTKSDRQVYIEYVSGVYAPGVFSLQVGVGSNQDSQIEAKMSFKLQDVELLRNIGLDDENYSSTIKTILTEVSAKQTEYGAIQNRLESALDEISIQYENLVSSRSTIRDADIALESASYIQQQILQQASATLIATANQSPAIALQLI